MRYRWKEVPLLFTSPLGRQRIKAAARYYSWPIAAPIASLYRRSFLRKTKFVTLTGSFGKTTTARCVLAALEGEEDPRIGGNSWTSQAMAVLRTPPSRKFAVIEVGIAFVGEMEVFARFHRPDIVIVTGIGSEHNRSFPTLETTREEKVHLVRAVSSDGVVILNGDDPHVLWMASQTRARIVTYGFGENNDIRAERCDLNWPDGNLLRVSVHGATREFKSRLLGRHMAYPVLAAIAAASSQGISPEHFAPALGRVAPARGRLEVRELESGIFLVCDDFKSAPETVESALQLLARIPASRRLVVMGDISEPPGRQGPVYRHFGRRIAETADAAVFIGTSGRSYQTGARRAGMPVEAIHLAGRSALSTARTVRRMMRPGDVILIKGRDTQRLERVALELEGRPVACDISFCRAARTRCGDCPMLERGWKGKRVLT